MFLATTALEEFWDSSAPLLFLGAWCVPWSQRETRMKAGDVVMRSVWDDRRRFYEAVTYSDRCAERLLSRLTTYLDGVHGERRGLQYWRVLLGAWVVQYVHSSYDRWINLETAFSEYSDLRTIVLHPDCFVTPRTGAEVYEWLGDDGYNLQLYSQLLHARSCFPARRSVLLLRKGTPAAARRTAAARRLIAAAERAVARRLNARVGLTGISLSWAKRWSLAVRTKGDLLPIPPLEQESFAGPAPVFDQRRRALAELRAEDTFERAIVAALPVNFPTIYLEGHHKAKTAARAALRDIRVQAILSETDWYGLESVRHLAAEAAAAGTKLVGMQHGGGYGVYRFSPVEEHEKRATDQFLVWGWADAAPLRNWPSLTLSNQRQACSGSARGVLFVLTTQRRYPHWFISQPTGTQMEGYCAWHDRFLAALPDPLRSSVTVRPHELDYQQDIWTRIASRFPQVRRDRPQPLSRAMCRNAIVVIDHCATAMLEALVRDIPTVLFWDPRLWEMRPAAEPFFDALRRVGVLHHDPETAARHVAHVYPEASVWWRSGDIQDARRAFVDRFALSRPGGARAWARGLAGHITA